MAGKIHELRQRRQDLVAEGRKLLDASDEEQREPTAEEEARHGEIMAEVKKVDSLISREEQQLDSERTMDRISSVRPDEPPAADAPDEPSNVEVVDNPMRAVGQFIQGVAYRSSPGGIGGLQAAAQGMQQAEPSKGGFAVFPAMAQTIWDRMSQAPDNLLEMTDQYTVEGESLIFPADDESDLSSPDTVAYWIKEAAQATNSNPKLRDFKIEPQELIVMIPATEKLLRNSPIALGQYISRKAERAIRQKVNTAIVSGDGSGKPKGLLNSGALISVAKETGQLAATIEAENISKMWARLHPDARGGAVWLHNVDIEPQLDQLSYAVGTSGQLVYMPAGGLSGNAFATIKGRPLVPVQACKTLGTVGDLILTNLDFYATGLRRDGIMEAVSMHLRFDYAEMMFRFIFEIDGATWLNSAITPEQGSNTLSTVVALATRA